MNEEAEEELEKHLMKMLYGNEIQCSCGNKMYAKYTKREGVGLTDEEAKKTFEEHNCVISADLAGILARAIEAKLKEKNNG